MIPLSRDEALKVLESAPVAHLGMIDDGVPYVTPMSFVLAGERVLFRTMAGRKLNALRANPRVCIEVSDYNAETGDWMSVIIRGTAREVEEPEIGSATVAMLFRKYETVMGSPLSPGGGPQPLPGLPHIIEVEIEDLSGLSSGRGWSTRTRPGRL